VQRAHVGRSKGSGASGSARCSWFSKTSRGDLAGGAMTRVPASPDTRPSRAPACQRGRGSAPAEEVLPEVGDPPLHFRFPGGVARDSGIDDEAAVLRVLEEAARDRGRLAIGAARTSGNHSRGSTPDARWPKDANSVQGSLHLSK